MKKWISKHKFKHLHYAERIRDALREHKESIEIIVVEDQRFALSAYFHDEKAHYMYDTFVNGFVDGVVYERTVYEQKTKEVTVEIKEDFTEELKKL
jgi:gluconate kinase